MRYVVPALTFGNPLLGMLAGGLKAASPVALLLAMLAPMAYLRQFSRRRLVDTQIDLDSIRAMSWKDFELLVGEGFRRLGYLVEERGGAAPDGGVDLVLRKGCATTLVQCKQWRAKQVGVSTVRELYGVMIAEKADDALLVSCGTFTPDTVAFAHGKPIGLLDGQALLELVKVVQNKKVASAKSTPHAGVPSCPVCQRPMVRRRSRPGARSGRAFWGCSAYPSCKGTRSL